MLAELLLILPVLATSDNPKMIKRMAVNSNLFLFVINTDYDKCPLL